MTSILKPGKILIMRFFLCENLLRHYTCLSVMCIYARSKSDVHKKNKGNVCTCLAFSTSTLSRGSSISLRCDFILSQFHLPSTLIAKIVLFVHLSLSLEAKQFNQERGWYLVEREKSKKQDSDTGN
jgi:hypothetical protein